MTSTTIERKRGPEWFGGLPSDWEVVPTRSLFKNKKELVGNNAENFVLLGLTMRGVLPRDVNAGGKNPSDYDNYQVFLPGELVMCLFDYDVTPRTVGLVKEEGILTGAYTRLISRVEMDSRYFYYLYLYLDERKELLHLCTGLRNAISKPVFWALQNPKPPIESQKRIADFLDAKTKTVDELIAKKEQLIELLKEKRAAIITQAVTKGLDPKVKLKTSGIEWLGDIPEHWSIQPARALLRDRREKNKKLVSDNILSVMRGVGVIRYADKGNVGNKSSDNPENYKIVYPGDIVINSMNLVIGSVGLSREFGVTSSVYIIYREVEGVSLTDYYHNVFLIEGLQRHLGKFGKGIMELREAVKHGDIKNQLFPHPPLKEQRKIADFLAERITKINSAISLVENQVETLREYRSSLIYSAVTGKIEI